MARGTQHRKRRPATNARLAQPAPKAQRPKQAAWEDQLFFSRLRGHAKWVFVFLAIVFAFSFVIFGVGSGSTGISDALQNFFSQSVSSGSSLSSLQKKATKNPKDPTAWRNLATKLEQKQDIDRAIVALQHYTKLRPKEQSGLEELASLYTRRANDYLNLYSTYQSQTPLLTPGSPFEPLSTSKLGAAYQSTSALEDPIAHALALAVNVKANAALTRLKSIENETTSTYQRLVKLDPANATNQYQLGIVAQAAGSTAVAKKALTTFLKLAPQDSLVPDAKAALKQLAGTSTSSVTAG